MIPLHGLVLSGGRSTRMGRDKGSLVLATGPGLEDQRTRLHRMLDQVCGQAWISCREDQAELVPKGIPRISRTCGIHGE